MAPILGAGAKGVKRRPPPALAMGGAPPRPLTHSWKRCQFSIVHKGSRTVDYSPAGGAWTAGFGPEFTVSGTPPAPPGLRAAPRGCPTGERGGRHGRQLSNSGASSANSASFAPLGARRVRGARRLSASPAGERLGVTCRGGGGLARQLARRGVPPRCRRRRGHAPRPPPRGAGRSRPCSAALTAAPSTCSPPRPPQPASTRATPWASSRRCGWTRRGAGLRQMAAGPAYSGGSVQIEYSTFTLHSLVVYWGHDRA